MHEPRVQPLEPDQWNDEASEVLAPLAATGNTLNIFKVLANHPKLLKRWMVFANHVMMKSTLPPRDRELAILRVGWLLRSEYEWGQHVAIAKMVGLTDDEIRRVAQGSGAAGWTELESAILEAADELTDNADISDSTWQTLSSHYDTQQLIDLVFTVGQYTLVSMALKTLGVPLDDGLEGFPD